MKIFPSWKITQKWLEPNPSYKSGYHPGLDYACPIGTPICAPYDGRITKVFDNDPSRGNALHYLFSLNGKDYAIRCLHLNKVPIVGTYKQGDIIGYTGNTGMSTGPHLHIDLWKDGYIRPEKIITLQGIKDNQLDPLTPGILV